jgi:hypothetical protein
LCCDPYHEYGKKNGPEIFYFHVYIVRGGFIFLNQAHLLTQNSSPLPFALEQPTLSGEDATSQHFLPVDGKAGHWIMVVFGQFQNSQQFCGF